MLNPGDFAITKRGTVLYTSLSDNMIGQAFSVELDHFVVVVGIRFTPSVTGSIYPQRWAFVLLNNGGTKFGWVHVSSLWRADDSTP